MDEIGDELNDKPENNGPVEEPSELTSESEELNKDDDDLPEFFGESDEIDYDLPEIFGESDEIDDDLPEIFGESEEFDDDLPEIFSENDEFDDDLPEIFGENDEFNNEILDDGIQDNEENERVGENEDSGDVGNVHENENLGSQSTLTVSPSEMEEIENNLEPREQEEEIEIPPEEYQNDKELLVDPNEIEFVEKIEKLAEYARETIGEDETVEPQVEKEHAAYYAEQYYEKLKEKGVFTDQNSKEEQEIEEPRQDITEENKNKEDINEESEENMSPEEFEYLWDVRDRIDQEGKSLEEIKEVMHEAEEMYQTLKDAEKLYEVQQEEKLKLVDHEDEASVEDLKEDLDRIDLINQTVELEENLAEQGKSQEEIDMNVEDAIKTTELEEQSEKLNEKEQKELIDHEDEASIEDLKEDLDRVDIIEKVVDLEENLVQQGESQEEIDLRVEQVIETTEFEEQSEILAEKEHKELIDREDEASIEDLKEDLDRVDIIEKVVDLEENLVQQGESQEEIDLRVEQVIETTEFEEQSEILAEKEHKELIDREDEASEEDQKEDLDRVDLIENSVDLEEDLIQQEKSQEEINIIVEEGIEKTIETSEFEESIEKLYKEQERNKSKLKDLEDEEATGNLKEDLDRVDVIENTVDLEENSVPKEKSQEKIDISEKLEELKPELDALEGESEGRTDLLRERIKLKSEEAKEKEDEHLQELYRQEMGKRPIYSKKKTKGYIQWLEQRELKSEKIRSSQTETETKKEIEDEDWKKTLKKWIKEASEDECSAELKSELKKALESYNGFEDLTRKFFELYKKSQNEKLSEKEKSRMTFLLEKLQEFDPIQLELLANVRAIKKYIVEQYAWDSMNRFRDYQVRNKFFKHISHKYENLKNQTLKLKELISSDTKKNLMNQSNRPDENIKILLNKNDLTLKGYNYVRKEILREHKDEAIYSKILQYADIVLKKQIKLVKLPLYKTSQVRLTTQQKLVDIYEGKDYVTEKNKYYEFVNKYRDYEALVYLIKCKNGFPSNWFKGKRYFGYTHSTEKIRFRYHIREAIEQYMDYHNMFRSEEPTKLNWAICIALEDLGYRINEISYLFEVEDVYSQIKFLEKLAYELEENYFDVINLAFHKKLKTALKHEIKLIAKYGTTSELNECGGGQGGQPYIPLPLYDIVGMIALGCTQKRICKIINKLYKNDFNRGKVAENTLRRRIIEEFEGWLNAQKLFLKPIVEALVYKGFSDRKIYNILSSPHSREGWLYIWWKNGEELDFNSWSELDENKIKKILKYNEEKYCGIPKSKWEEWVINDVPNYEIAKVTGLRFDTIVSVYKDKFGGRNKILFKHRRETTIKLRERGMSLKEIYTSVFKKTYYHSNFKRDFKTWFDNMTPKQIEERWGSNKD